MRYIGNVTKIGLEVALNHCNAIRIHATWYSQPNECERLWLVCSITQSKINIITIQWIKPGILDVRDESDIKHLAKI